MSPAVSLVTRRWGNTVYTPEQVLSIPLGYDRAVTPVGAVLPGTPDHELRRALDRCSRVVVAFDGKLGDSLLAFGGVTAITEALTLLGRTVPISSLGRYGCLYPTTSTACPHSCSPRLIIGDDTGVELARPTDDDHVLLCSPEQAPVETTANAPTPTCPPATTWIWRSESASGYQVIRRSYRPWPAMPLSPSERR
ncbi:hypothetical protein HFP72_04650 [Nocardiopsis sp. ARC36]